MIDVGTYAASLVSILLLKPAPPAPDAERASVRTILEGFRFVRRKPVIMGIFLLDTNAMIFGMPSALFPALADERFDAGAAVVGFLYAAPYGGALLAVLLSGWIQHVRRQGLAVALAASAWGLAIVGVGFAESLWLCLLAARRGGCGRQHQRRVALDDRAQPDAEAHAGPGLRDGAGAGRFRTGSGKSGGRHCRLPDEPALLDRLRRFRVHRRLRRDPRCDPVPASLRLEEPPRMKLRRGFFDRSVHEVAPELVGAKLLFDGVGGTIVEVEAYDHEDPAAHGYRGRTARNASMFGPPGHAYVYRSYGVHWCLNFVCEAEGVASAVLIRALEPTEGLDAMRARRGLDDPRLLCSGPGRLCQALGITGEQDGRPLDRSPFEVHARAREEQVLTGPRIGITRAADRPWRYGLAGSRFLSRSLRPRP